MDFPHFREVHRQDRDRLLFSKVNFAWCGSYVQLYTLLCTFFYEHTHFLSPIKKEINEKILSFLFLGCLPVCDDSLSTRVYQSAPVQTSLPPTFCPLALAIISNNHSRSGSKKKKTQQRLGTRWDTSMCSFFRHFSSTIQDFFFARLLCFYLFFLLEATMNKKKTELTVCLFLCSYVRCSGGKRNIYFLIQGSLRKCISHLHAQ